MKELRKIGCFVAGVIAVFIVLRVVESIHVFGVLSPNTVFDPANSVTSSFGVYRDFVTVITGLLTLLIAIIGLGSFFSFKKIREDEQNAIDKIKNEQIKFETLRNNLIERESNEKKEFSEFKIKMDRYAKLLQIKALLNSESEKDAAIKVFEKANTSDIGEELYHQLKGDAYYSRGEFGDYAIAVEEYKKAIKHNEKSSRAWFGLGQAKYKNSVRTIEDEGDTIPDIYDAMKFKPKLDSFNILDIYEVNSAIECIKKSMSYDMDFAEAGFELGHIYKALKKYDDALSTYSNVLSINPNHRACAYFYCQLWIYDNYALLKQGAADENELLRVVELLKRVGLFDVYNNKFAYALLWYIYAVDPNFKDVESTKSAYSATTNFAISTLFELGG